MKTAQCLLGVLLLTAPGACFAEDKAGDLAGGLLVAAGLTSSLWQDGSAGKSHAARTLDGFLATAAVTEGLKLSVRERRPDRDARDSFPSMHTSLSFAVASAQAYYHPNQAALWYGAAAFVGYRRVQSREHHLGDVLAGAALGLALGRASVTSRRGWLVAPTIENGHPMVAIFYRN